MPDITMCVTTTCKKRGRCWRFIAPPSPQSQSMAMFVPDEDGTCSNFWRLDFRQGKPPENAHDEEKERKSP